MIWTGPISPPTKLFLSVPKTLPNLLYRLPYKIAECVQVDIRGTIWHSIMHQYIFIKKAQGGEIESSRCCMPTEVKLNFSLSATSASIKSNLHCSADGWKPKATLHNYTTGVQFLNRIMYMFQSWLHQIQICHYLCHRGYVFTRVHVVCWFLWKQDYAKTHSTKLGGRMEHFFFL